MKCFIVLSAIVACCLALPVDNFVQVTRNTNGNYATLYKAGDIHAFEESNNGEVVGKYSFVDDEGTRQAVQYTAGVGGFVAEGTHLPVPVVDNLEVVEARNEHLRAYNEALKVLPITDEYYYSEEPVPAVRQIKYVPILA